MYFLTPISLLSLSLWLLISTSLAHSASEIIPGCQGEGCHCFQGYRGSETNGIPGKNDIKTIRPFKLYKDRSKNSKMVGKFEAGIKARPLKQELVIEDKGEYVVETVQSSKLSLKRGDKINTIVNLGEGFFKGRQNDKWIEFDYENLKLKTIKETKITAWLFVKVGELNGFTQDLPFEMCLE